jgi:nucleotide-binding universal stress UspA family protein
MPDGPALLCYDGSDPARRAIEEAGRLLGGGPAIALTVWESIGSVVLRHGVPLPGEVGRDTRALAEEVIDELDARTAERAKAAAEEGARLAAAAGFDARPEARRALARAAERDEVTVWHAILDYADEHDARAVVLGSRGLSHPVAALLGSVSYGIVHHSRRPLLVVPPAAG